MSELIRPENFAELLGVNLATGKRFSERVQTARSKHSLIYFFGFSQRLSFYVNPCHGHRQAKDRAATGLVLCPQVAAMGLDDRACNRRG
jgi:hypothetical protein